ncbi:DNA primase [Alkalicoccus saliphilus]|jgi:DNA primase|uniref:DNA primase n=1 Tax=Alkalicoccus saliphilus TaxID=200989 RepID=A0A2T4UAV7_9BACI|nr:DNA primase [Alkalicoccus saliphilus]PTL40536.1 DNA primase [Alkalicoccus saliphilus]
MAQRIPEETVEKVRRELDIVDVVSEYVQLKKQGRNFTGLCPFHGEKTPSFSVSQDKQLYHCFGCGAGGSIFTFVMEFEGLSFLETVQKLASKTSVELPEIAPEQSTPEQEEAGVWYDGHELAMKLYHHLLVSSPEGRKAREYLRKRGFTKEMIERFQLGYAPDSWSFLTDFLQKRNFLPRDMADCGLLALRESDGRPFDRFRNRIMFPIWDKSGRVIAFGGRVLEADDKPKYLNSPESQVFNKSRLLYYFHGARPAVKRKNEAVLFEGYVDVISAFRAGIEHGVGALGTALSEEQAKMLRRNADRVILCYDGDEAGQKAAWKNAEILKKSGLEVFVAALPEGMDPDDYIKEYGADRFADTVIGQPRTLMEFKSVYLRRNKNMSQEADQLRFVEEMLIEISRLPKAIERDHYIRRLEEEFSLSYDVLKQEMKEHVQNNVQARTKQQKQIQRKVTAEQVRKMLTADEKAESDLIAMMIHSREAAEDVENRIGSAFQYETYQALAALLYSFYAAGHESDPAGFLETIGDAELKQTAAALAMKEVHVDLSEQVMEDYARQIIHRTPARKQIEELQQLMKQTNDVEQLKNYAAKMLELKTKMQ